MAVYGAKINIHQLNILAATIVLANGFSRLVDIPPRGFRISLWNIQWSVEIGGRLLFMLLLALLVVIGAETIFRSHPIFQERTAGTKKQSTIVHWILPGLSAFGGSTAVSLLPAGPRWWLGLVIVTALLILSVLFEFIVIDRSDSRHDPAAIGLNVLGLTLLAIIFNAVIASSARLAFALPVIALSTIVIAFRLLNLILPYTPRMAIYAIGIGIIVTELAIPLSFLPISSILFALILTLATHTLAGIAQAARGTGITRSTLLEYGFLDAIAVLLILVLVGR